MDTGEDSDDSSPADALEKFREKWQHELETTTQKAKHKHTNKTRNNDGIDDEEKARKYFVEGVELEKVGKVFEAMRLYSRAVHIDPDIEFKIYEESKRTQNNNNNSESTLISISLLDNALENSQEDAEDLTNVDLIVHFQTAIRNNNGVMFQRCSSNIDNNVIYTGLHFSDLPIEIVFYILRWVVSSDLDLRSLEQCSMVSKGFYLCARDPEIWRLACMKIWGLHVGQLKDTKYTSWRQMYTERPRVWFNGCYISKTSYLRYGERSFQDQFYRPVHLIEYYRYVRFFPDGTALMLTSPDEPAQTVGKLSNKTGLRNEVLKGHFRFTNDVVIIVLKRNQEKSHFNKTRNMAESEIDNHTFCLQLQMSYTKKRRCPQLQWLSYSIIQRQNRCDEMKTDFDLTPTKYPALIFSRVKSYDSYSEIPIQ